MKFLRSIQDKVPLVLLIGNHDRANNNVIKIYDKF
jgi:DNA repair exonuclease SbcCD nuclease subunit